MRCHPIIIIITVHKCISTQHQEQQLSTGVSAVHICKYLTTNKQLFVHKNVQLQNVSHNESISAKIICIRELPINTLLPLFRKTVFSKVSCGIFTSLSACKKYVEQCKI